MKTLAFIAVALALSACSTQSEQSSGPSFVIHNPEIFGKSPPSVDDNGISLTVLSSPAPAAQHDAWWAGTGRMVD